MNDWQLLIVGAGLSGLAAAQQAHHDGLDKVLLIDYQCEIGGFTRLYMQSSAFEQERELLASASKLPYTIWTQSTAIGLFVDMQESGEASTQMMVQTPKQSLVVQADQVLITTGALEKPREAQKIAGDRPAGIMTPMMAAQLLERGYKPGERIVLMYSGRISEGVSQLLRSSGCQLTVLEEDSYEVIFVRGGSRIEEVTVRNCQTGVEERLLCDTLIYNKGRLPGTFFLKGSEIERDPHLSIQVERNGRTRVSNVFAAGSCTIHGDDNHLNSMELGRVAMRELLNCK